MSHPSDRATPSSTFALALLATSLFFLYFAKDIPASSLSGASDPGPRFLPVALCIALLAGAGIEGALAFKVHLTTSRSQPASSKPAESREGSLWSVAVLIGMLFAYLVAISWIGFQISTLLFGVAITMRLGARWWTGILVSLAIVAVVRILFVGVFHVQLPGGVWDIAI